METAKPYNCQCFICGIAVDLKMFAHRNTDNSLVGWVFVCAKDEHLIKGRNLAISLEPFRDGNKENGEQFTSALGRPPTNKMETV